MYRHEKTFLIDFIFLGVFTLLTVYCGLQLSWVGFGIWLALAILRLVMLVIHQIKWRMIYKFEIEQLKNTINKDENEDE